MLPLPPPGRQSNYPPIFPQEKEKTFFSSRTFLTRRSPCATLPAGSSHLLLATHPRPLYHPPLTSLSAASHKQKNAGPQHCAANPLITFVKRAQKSVDFPLKKAHVGTPGLYALASAARTYSLTARIHYYPFLSPFLQGKEKNRSKFSRFEYIARTHFVRPHDVRDWPVAPRPLKNM